MLSQGVDLCIGLGAEKYLDSVKVGRNGSVVCFCFDGDRFGLVAHPPKE